MQMLLPTVAGSQDLPSYNGIVTGWTEVTKEVLAAQAAADGAEVHTPNTRLHTHTPHICSRPYGLTHTHVYTLSLPFALSPGLPRMHSPSTTVCSFLRAYMQTYIHTYIHAYRRTYIHTNTLT